MAIVSLNRQTYLDDSCLDKSFAICPRPPVPGREDDQMPVDCCDPCTRLDILDDGSRKGGRADRKPQTTPEVLPQPILKASAVESCLALKHNTNTKLETSGCASAVGYVSNGGPSGAVSCLKWGEGLDSLLRDSDGVRLFKEFLNQEQDLSSVDFWFACSGLKMIGPADLEKIIGLSKLVYKKYIRGETLRLRSDVKRRIVDRMKRGSVDQTIFDEAKAEIELSMRNNLYPLFLKSDLYLQYVQNGQESPKQSGNLSGRDPLNQTPGEVNNLPTLHEDKELASKDLGHSSSMLLTSSSLLATRKSREGFPAQFYGRCAYPSAPPRQINPYHISYAPVSAQDSELQSLSSDAQTDDAMSHAEGASLCCDGRDQRSYKNNRTLFKMQMKAMRSCAEANHENDIHFMQQFVPRTERVPVDSTLAETDPVCFAGRLMEKLLLVKRETDQMQTMKNSLRSIDDSDREELSLSLQMRNAHYRPHNSFRDTAGQSFSLASMLLASTISSSSDLEEDNAQSILDDHVSHVWNSSGATPSRSPGFRTPPDRPRHDPPPTRHQPLPLPPQAAQRTRGDSCGGRSPFAPVTAAAAAHGRTIHNKDGRILPSDASLVQTGHRHLQQRHHHHHHQQQQQQQPKETRSWPHHLTSQSDAHLVAKRHSPVLNRSAVDAAAKLSSNARKNVDSSNRSFDAGNDRPNAIEENGQNDLQRVLLWMLDSEKCCGKGNKNRCSLDGSDKGSSSHKRSSHKSANSGSKKTSHQKSNRSESLDRSRLTTDLALTRPSSGQTTTALVVHDRTLVPPNASFVPPGAHSAEAKHRPVPEKRHFQMKIRSELLDEPIIQPQNNNIPFHNLSTNWSIPPSTETAFHQSLSDEHLSNSQTSDTKRTSANNVANESMTVVGCYFCDEPIPYRMTLPGSTVTLGQFKQLISKKGNFRYFFKKACTEFESGVVHEEITCDADILPLWEGKIVCKVERIH